MFTTLKVSDSTSGLETLRVRNQMTQKRRAPLVQNACTNCRTKKLRCSGEEKGCRRCLAKAIDCVYQPSNGKSRAPDARSHAVRKASNQTSNEFSSGHTGTPEDCTLNNTDHTDNSTFGDIRDFDFGLFTESELIDPSLDGLGSSFHIHEGTISPHVQSPPGDSVVSEDVLSRVLPVSTSMPTATTLRADASDFSTDSSSSQLTRSSISRNSSVSSANGVDLYLENNGGRSAGVQQLQSFHPEPSAAEKQQHQQQKHKGECPCITKVLLAYQDINMYLDGTASITRVEAHSYNHHLGALVGSHRPTNNQGSYTDQQQVPVETALHCIKSCLETCEILMDCQACSARSECIMLNISMCDTMVSRTEELVGVTDLSPFSPSSASSTSGARNNAMPLSSDSNQSLGASSRASQRKDYALGVQSHSGLRIGHWRLDNEDEVQVIQSLLTARMTRLDGLTARMKRVAQQNEWPVHDARVSGVRERLLAAIFLAKKRSFT